MVEPRDSDQTGHVGTVGHIYGDVVSIHITSVLAQLKVADNSLVGRLSVLQLEGVSGGRIFCISQTVFTLDNDSAVFQRRGSATGSCIHNYLVAAGITDKQEFTVSKGTNSYRSANEIFLSVAIPVALGEVA